MEVKIKSACGIPYFQQLSWLFINTLGPRDVTYQQYGVFKKFFLRSEGNKPLEIGNSVYFKQGKTERKKN